MSQGIDAFNAGLLGGEIDVQHASLTSREPGEAQLAVGQVEDSKLPVKSRVSVSQPDQPLGATDESILSL